MPRQKIQKSRKEANCRHEGRSKRHAARPRNNGKPFPQLLEAVSIAVHRNSEDLSTRPGFEKVRRETFLPRAWYFLLMALSQLENFPMRLIVTLIVIVSALETHVLAAEAPQVPVGAKVPAFALKDFRGHEHRIAPTDEAKVTVIAVLGTECPLAKLYTARLQDIADQYQDRGVRMIGLNANTQDSISKLAAYAQRHELTFPLLKDVGNRVVDTLGATRTPEVVLLDNEHVIRYRGRIDDQYGIGYGKEKPTQTFLIDAVEALLANRPVETTSVEPIGCLIGRTREPADDANVTYTDDVAEILNQRCVECHREGQIAPFSLTDYESASGWASMIAEVVREDRMPPWHAAEPVPGSTSHDGETLHYVAGVDYANSRRLSDDERETLLAWAKQGAPEGASPRPQIPEDSVEDWQLSSPPDAVFTMSEQPFEVPAEGVVKYRYFRVDPGFTEDKWIRAAEVVPGNRAVVHHVLVFTRAKGSREDIGGEAGRGFLAAYVPGLKAAEYPAGMAKLVPANSELIFQVHYTPIGSPQTDQSRIGLVFANPEEVEHLVETRNVVNGRFEIEPEKADQKFSASNAIQDDNAQLLAMMPHMHLRGQAFRYSLRRDGKQQTLLDVPRYDFNWQTGYLLSEPLPLKKGDRIVCDAWFDNSAENLANPDPTATVRWGDQTWNEMMIGYYDVAVPLDDQAKAGARSGHLAARIRNVLTDRLSERIQRTLDQYDANGDGAVTIDELPERLHPLHARLDVDRDGRVTAEELRPFVERTAE